MGTQAEPVKPMIQIVRQLQIVQTHQQMKHLLNQMHQLQVLTQPRLLTRLGM